MGLIGFIKSLTRAVRRDGTKVDEYVADLGGEEFLTVEHFGTAGDDSPARSEDRVAIFGITGRGRAVCLGYIDAKNEQLAQQGERRLYSRDGSGNRVAQTWLKSNGSVRTENASGSYELKPDGSVRTENASGYYELKADGTVDANGTTIAPNGDVTCPGKITAQEIAAPSIKAAGLELAGHKHSNGTAIDGNTGVNLP